MITHYHLHKGEPAKLQFEIYSLKEYLIESAEDAAAYLKTDLFHNDVVKELAPLFNKAPEIKIYTIA